MVKFAFLNELFHDPDRLFNRPGGIYPCVFEDINPFCASELCIDVIYGSADVFLAENIREYQERSLPLV